MNILMFGWEFPPHISGGLGTACFGLTWGLYQHHIPITFVLPALKYGVDSPEHVQCIGSNEIDISKMDSLYKMLQNEISFVSIQSLLHPYINEVEYTKTFSHLMQEQMIIEEKSNTYKLQITGEYGPNLMSEVMRYAQVGAAISQQYPHDIIHCHDWLTILAGIYAKKISKKPLIFHVHALEYDRSGEHINPRIFEIEKTGMIEADRIIAVSNYTKNIIMKRYLIPEEKIMVVHNAVLEQTIKNRKRKKRPFRERIVLFLGRITFQKGPDYFIEAAAHILKKRKDIHFVMAGKGDMTSSMIDRVAKLKIGRYFHFTGFLSADEVDNIFDYSDVYVMPSVSEPFGISPLEAMRHDVPVIISKQSGVSEVLPSAMKVDFWDVQAMANQILSLIDNKTLRNEVVSKCSKEIEALQWERAAVNVLKIYNSLSL